MESLRDISVQLGISACLLGQRVRYDGRSRQVPWLPSVLGEPGMQVTWVPVCPEVELGLGVPREPIGLIRPAAGALLRLLAFDSKRDLTAAMNELVLARADELAARGIAGYIVKARSPSCGIADVPIFAGTDQGVSSPVVDKGRGVFAEALIARLPELPVASDEDLAEPEVRAAFVRRVECYHRSRMGP